ncbi:15869_t:CDS:2 [Entrophospora sp. SA101]|nr:15869_t:CDS:2 [Entrophospora sp. SA101]
MKITLKVKFQKRNRSQINLDGSREKSEEEEDEGIDITPIHSSIRVRFHKIWNTIIHVIGVGDMSIGEIILLLFFIFFNLFYTFYPFQSSSNTNFSTDLNNRAGWIGVANAAFVFPLASRNSIFLTFLGIPYERIIKFHRWTGRMIIVCILLHGMGHIQKRYREVGDLYTTIFGNITYARGFVAFLALALLGLSSLSIFRRRYFEFFYWAHIVGFITFAIASIVHQPSNLYFEILGISLYLMDVSIRFFLSMKKAKIVKLETIDDDITKVTFKYNMFYEAGQYIFVHFSNLKRPLSTLAWHPVSISSSPTSFLSLNNNISTIHLKTIGKFTNLLFNRASRESNVINPTLNISIEGPYGKSGVEFMDHETVMLFSGGIGVTPMISILRNLVDRLISGMAIATNAIYFIWVVPNLDSYHWFSTELQEVQDKFNTIPNNSCILDIQIFITRPNSNDDISTSSILHVGRPKFEVIMQDVKRYQGSGDVAVGVCGPSLMLKDVTNAAISQSTRKGLFIVHTETFELATVPAGTVAVPIEDKSNYDDVLSNTGVDLKEETDNILRENEIIGLRQPSSIFQPDPIKQHKAMMNMHPDCLTYLALATQERITNLVEAMIAAKNNRIESENVKFPTLSPEEEESNNSNPSPIYKQVLVSDAKSQLLALEKIEREEERKRRELLFGPEITENNEKSDDMNGPIDPPPPKRKRQKKDSNANAALQRLTNEAIATKITNQTALVAAGGLTKSWMLAATEETPIIPSLPVTTNGKTNTNINTDTTATASSGRQPRSRSLSVSAGKTTKRDINTAFGGKSSSSQYNTSSNKQKFANGSTTSSKQQSESNDSSNSLVTMKDALFVLERDRGGGGTNSLVKGYIKWLR